MMRELVDSGEIPRGEKMLFSGTDPESKITEYTSVYEEYHLVNLSVQQHPAQLLADLIQQFLTSLTNRINLVATLLPPEELAEDAISYANTCNL
jgi:hypothetical protein